MFRGSCADSVFPGVRLGAWRDQSHVSDTRWTSSLAAHCPQEFPQHREETPPPGPDGLKSCPPGSATMPGSGSPTSGSRPPGRSSPAATVYELRSSNGPPPPPGARCCCGAAEGPAAAVSAVSASLGTAQVELPPTPSAPGQALPGLRIPLPAGLPPTGGTQGRPAQLDRTRRHLQLQPWRIQCRLRCRRRRGHRVQVGDLLPGQLLAGLGPSQQLISVGHMPPGPVFRGLVRRKPPLR